MLVPRLQQISSRIDANLAYIDKASPADEESPKRWHESVELTKEFLTTEGSLGERPTKAALRARSDDSEVNFLTMHYRWFTRVHPYPSQYNFIQWRDDQGELQIHERTGEDRFAVYDVRVQDKVALTLGVPSGYNPDIRVTAYVLEGNRWSSSNNVIAVPDLEDRGVRRRGSGLQFERQKWKVDMDTTSASTVVELREKFRNEEGRLVTPDKPTAYLRYQGEHLVWDEPDRDRAEIERLAAGGGDGPDVEMEPGGIQVGDFFISN